MTLNSRVAQASEQFLFDALRKVTRSNDDGALNFIEVRDFESKSDEDIAATIEEFSNIAKDDDALAKWAEGKFTEADENGDQYLQKDELKGVFE